MNFKKSATSGEYLIGIMENNSVVVYRNYDNVKGALREIAEQENFQYDNNWTTRQFGAKVCKEFGDGKMAVVGCYTVRILESGSVDVFRTYENTKGALREISEEAGFDFDQNWTTHQLGSKLVDFINKN